MHRVCSRVVLLEGSQNYNSVFQTIGRIHRLGQTVPQKAWILFQDHTVQWYVEYNCTRKILLQVAAQFRPYLEAEGAHATRLIAAPSTLIATPAALPVLTDDSATPHDVATSEGAPTPADGLTPSEDDITPLVSSINRAEDPVLSRLAYKVLTEILGLALDAPNWLEMGDYHTLGLNGQTSNGIFYSTRGLKSSDLTPVTPIKAHRARKRLASPRSLFERTAKTRRGSPVEK
jgi:hypothetical protein